MLRLIKWWLTITNFALIVGLILGLRTEKKYFFAIQIPVIKIIGKADTWTTFCF